MGKGSVDVENCSFDWKEKAEARAWAKKMLAAGARVFFDDNGSDVHDLYCGPSEKVIVQRVKEAGGARGGYSITKLVEVTSPSEIG